MRKYFILFLVFLGTLYFSPGYSDESCAFCKPEVLKAQAFYEDDLCYILYTHKPIVQDHCLIIPKRHVELFHELSDAESARMGDLVKKLHNSLGERPYLLLQKNGSEVGQTVPHVHIHYLPYEGDSTFSFLVKMFWKNACCPISSEEMEQKTTAFKELLSK